MSDFLTVTPAIVPSAARKVRGCSMKEQAADRYGHATCCNDSGVHLDSATHHTGNIALNKNKYVVALSGLAASGMAYAGTPVGLSVGVAVGTTVGTAIAQATGLPIEAIGGGAVFAIAAIALVVGIRIVGRKQGR